MNSKVRKSLKSLHYDLGKAINLISGIQSDIEDIKSEEEDKYDNLPEGLKYARVGEDIESGIDSLNEILTQLEYAYDNLEDASNQIEELTE